MDKQFDIDQFNMKQIKNAQHMVGKRFPELVERYLSDSDKYIRRISEGLDCSDPEIVRKNAHSIKSSSASLGITGAYEVAKSLEGIAKDPEKQDANQMSQLADLLKEALEIANPKLKALIQNAA